MVEADRESEAAAPSGPPSTWSPPEVADFLRGLHLPDIVVESFLHNAVAGADLQELSDGDLSDHLGMTPLQIRKLRGALAQLGVTAPAAGNTKAASSAGPAEAAPSSPPAPDSSAATAAATAAAAAAAAAAAVAAVQTAAARAAPAVDAAVPPPPAAAALKDPAAYFEPAGLVRYSQLQEKVAQLQAMDVTSKLAAAQAYAGQMQLQLQAAQGAVPRTRASLAAKEKEAQRYATGGTCGCLCKGRAERKHGDAEDAAAQLRKQLEHQQAAAATAAAASSEAQSQLAAWQGKSAELATARASLQQLEERMFAGPAWRASPELNELGDSLRALEAQAAEAGQHAQSFGRGTQLLQGAVRGLQEALQALSRTQMMGAVNMGRGMGFQRRTGVNARRQPGRQFGNMTEMMVFRRANDGIAKAARDTAEASALLGPGMPRVDASVLSSARAGLLQNILIGGVISDAIQLAAVRRSIESCKVLLSQVQACLSWAQQNLGAHQQRTAALQAQVAGKRGEVQSFRRRALDSALAASAASA
ncbi:hypothetical protein ABPG77_006336 [Micractinium sp. CCAP 211/92]